MIKARGYYFFQIKALKPFFDEAHQHKNKGAIFFGSTKCRFAEYKANAERKGQVFSAPEKYFDPDAPRPEYLQFYYDDIDKNSNDSPYYGCVFYPERERTNPEADEIVTRKNQAFWAGGMAAQRDFILVTDIQFLFNPKYIANEIYWLLDHGYTCTPHPENPEFTLFKHPEKSQRICMNNYYQQEVKVQKTRAFKRLFPLKKMLFEKRNIKLTSELADIPNNDQYYQQYLLQTPVTFFKRQPPCKPQHTVAIALPTDNYRQHPPSP